MSAPAPDPAVAAAAAQLQQAAQEEAARVDPSAPYGYEQAVRLPNGDIYQEPVVPGMGASPVVPEPLIPGDPQPQAAEPAAAEEAPALQLDADTSGIEDLLTPDEVTDLAEEEPDFSEDEEPDFELDPSVAKKIKALEKKNAWLEEQRVKNGQPNWKAEAKRRFPLAAAIVDDLNEQSRKATLRKAAEVHNLAAKALEPMMGQLKAAADSVTAEATAEAKAHAQAAWGRPTSGPPQPMIEHAQAAAEEAALDRRNFKNLNDRVSALFKSGRLTI